MLAGQRNGGLAGLGFLRPHAKCFVVLFPFVVVTRSLDAASFFLRPLLVVVVAHAIIKIFLSNCFLFLFERGRERSRGRGIVQAGSAAGAITMSAASFVAPEP